jgi:hypothetical protein
MNCSQYVERPVSGRSRETERLSRLTGHGRSSAAELSRDFYAKLRGDI